MKNNLRKVLIGCLGLLLFSCYYDELVIYPDADDDANEPIPEVISFKSNIQPLFDESCIRCHKGSTDPVLEANVSYSNLINGYVVKGDANASLLYKSLIDDGAALMPPEGQWPDSKINLVKGWIDQGALDN